MGYYDDDEGSKALVYFGTMFSARGYHLIPRRHLCHPTLHDLVKRSEFLGSQIMRKFAFNEKLPDYEEVCDIFAEYKFIDDLIADRYINGKFNLNSKSKKIKVFICHSSLDKPFARLLTHDLEHLGFATWIDESKILAGQSIVSEINKAIETSTFMIVILSPRAIESKWVEREWSAKYIKEVEKNNIQVIPVLHEECKIPDLLRDKKYADFTTDYHMGLNNLMHSLKSLKACKAKS